VVVLSLIVTAGLGCGLADKLKARSEKGVDVPVRPGDARQTAPKGVMFESDAMIQDFLSQLKEKLGTDDPNVLDLLVYDQYAMIKVQDPKKPENIDGYTYRDGKLSDPAPVKIMGSGKIEDNVFRLSEVNLAALPKLTEEIREKLKDVEGGSIVGYSIDRGLPFKKDVEINPLLNSTRKTITADADKNGKLIKFEVK